jgi:hypothetical protein
MSVIVKGSGGKKSPGVNSITDLIDLTEEVASNNPKRVLAITPHTNTTTAPGASCAFPDGTICRVTTSTAVVLNAKGDTILSLTGLSVDLNNSSIFRIKHPTKQIYYFCGSNGKLHAFNVETQSYATIDGICFVYFDKWERLIAIPRASNDSNAFILDEATLATLNTVSMYADKDFTGTLTTIINIRHSTGSGYSNNRPCFTNKNWTVCPIGYTNVGGIAYDNHNIAYYIDNRVDVLEKGVILHFYSATTNGYFGYISKNDEYLITCDATNYAFKVWDFSSKKMGTLITTIPYFSAGAKYYHFSADFICKDGREMTVGIGDSGYPIILSFKDGEFNVIGFTTSIGVIIYNISRFSLREKTGSLYVDYGSNVIQCGIELEDYK